MRNYRQQNIILLAILCLLLFMAWLYSEGVVDGALGTLCYKMGRHQSAMWWFARALEKDPDNLSRQKKLQIAGGAAL